MDFKKENWLAFLAQKKGIGAWRLGLELKKSPQSVAGQQKRLSRAFNLLLDLHDFGFTWNEIGEALEKQREMEREEENEKGETP